MGNKQIFRVTEASLEAPHIMNRAYVKSLYKNATIVAGSNFYPFKIDLDFYI